MLDLIYLSQKYTFTLHFKLEKAHFQIVQIWLYLNIPGQDFNLNRTLAPEKKQILWKCDGVKYMPLILHY